MRVLVTGSNGFLGRHLVSAAIRAGHDVIALCRSRTPMLSDATVVQADLRDPHFDNVLADGIEAVCHCAASVSLTPTLDDYERLWLNNIVATQNLARAVLRHRIRRVVYTSSSSVYEMPAAVLPVSEEAAVRPGMPYAYTKHAGEQIWLATDFVQAGITTAILRCSSIYGAGQRRNSVLPIFVDHLLNGLKPVVIGCPFRSQDFVYIDDVANAHLQALTIPLDTTARVFNIGSGIETSLDSLAQTVTKIFGGTVDRIYTSVSPKNDGLSERFVLDITRARKELGFCPADLFSGLTRYRQAIEHSEKYEMQCS